MCLERGRERAFAFAHSTEARLRNLALAMKREMKRAMKGVEKEREEER